ncbi:hypothetical protein AC1031_006740 [Aphanomyces cochlioides]|nr:hypothetical protein AC1031_006740 [Aphanomyces cochlioides]
MAEEDEDIVLIAASLASAAVATYLEDDESYATLSLARFIRPALSYMAFFDLQQALLRDDGNKIVYDIFRMDTTELNQLVKMCEKFISRNLPCKDVVCVALHWLASGASARAQEQFFLDRAYSTIHEYRHIGINAILSALVENGCYGTDLNHSTRLEESSRQFAKIEPSFRGCIGAIDGTHVPIVVSKDLAGRYRNRKGYTCSRITPDRSKPSLTCNPIG